MKFGITTRNLMKQKSSAYDLSNILKPNKLDNNASHKEKIYLRKKITYIK